MPNWSQHDLQAYHARQQPRRIDVSFEPVADGKERELHNAILDECKRRRWVVYHGSMAHKTKRTVGEPDFVVCADGGRVFHVEAKTRTGKLSLEQRAMIADLRRLGHSAHVVRSLEEFLEIVRETELNTKEP